MDANVTAVLDLIFRWAHVVAGIAWIGHLYFFNFVNAPVAKTYDADSKKKVVPELMPRALYWFRWGAAYTWISGFLLLGLVIYGGGVIVAPDSPLPAGAASAIGVALLVVGFLVYDVLWKTMAKNEQAAVIVSFILVVLVLFVMNLLFSKRAVYIHLGSIFGTIMAANVWMRIWPNQRKIIAATKAGTAPDAAIVALAGLRSKHNTYMSVPLVFAMVSNHFPTIYGMDGSWILLAVLILVGWGVTKLLYKKAASPAPAQY
ncbi:MAG TPA: urate hydroxylase PuuD [Myxococcaceae bacterium]|nr:urate hydroxylase PuuD [Myxococcaceae bacterium]